MPSSFLRTRIATLEDVAALSVLVNSAYRGDSSKVGWTTEADLLGGQRTDPDTLQAMIETANNALLLFEEAGELRACVFLQKRGGCAYLGMLTVKPNLQGSGLGKQILATAEKWVIDCWQVSRMEMTVIQQRSELIEWYVRRGYTVTDRREPFPYGDEKFGLPKVPDLEFIVLEKTLTEPQTDPS